MIPVEPYYNEDHTKAAVLVSPGYGTGWSTANEDSRLAYDARIIQFYLDHYQDKEWMKQTRQHYTPACNELIAFINSILEYKNLDVNPLGFCNCQLEWISLNTPLMIDEYDGYETLVKRTAIDWIYLQ